MWPHPCTISLSLSHGMIAWITWRKANVNSRQALRRLQSVCDFVAPGGKRASLLDQLLGEQGHKQLPIQPSLGALRVALGQLPDLRNLFEALKHQFDLPTEPVELQNDFQGKLRCRERRQHH